MVRVEAIDPGIDFPRRHHTSGGGRRAGFGDHLGFPSQPAPLVRRMVEAGSGSAVTTGRGRIHPAQ